MDGFEESVPDANVQQVLEEDKKNFRKDLRKRLQQRIRGCRMGRQRAPTKEVGNNTMGDELMGMLGPKVAQSKRAQQLMASLNAGVNPKAATRGMNVNVTKQALKKGLNKLTGSKSSDKQATGAHPSTDAGMPDTRSKRERRRDKRRQKRKQARAWRRLKQMPDEVQGDDADDNSLEF